MEKPLHTMGLEDFLAWEERQPEKHEFHRGEIFAMVGGRRVHGIVSLNIASSLKGQLHGSPCRVFAESMRVQIADDTVLYPDIFVTCDAADLRTESVFRSPKLIVEVLSPSTQSYDRGAKFTFYRGIPALREYVLVDPDTREVQVFRRNADGLFTLHDLTGDAEVRLDCVDCTLRADEVFEGVDPA